MGKRIAMTSLFQLPLRVLCITILFSSFCLSQPAGRGRAVSPIPIAQARENDSQGIPKLLNQQVTITGFVTASNQFGIPAYIQDVTAGIAVYDGPFADSVSIGDEVLITGTVTQYNGLTELTNVAIEARLGSGNSVTPQLVTIADLLADGVNGIERYESSFIKINNVTVNTGTWTVTGSGVNYKLSDGRNTMDVRVDKEVDFANKPAPGGNFDIIGIVSQYQRTAPYIGGYQLMPRMMADILASGPRIVALPHESVIEANSITLEWKTYLSAAAYARYWEDESTVELGVISGSASGTDQQVRFTDLKPGTIYRVEAFSVAGSDTSFVAPMYVCSASATSTGTMNVYFNKSVDTTLCPSFPAHGNTVLKNKLLDRIDAAKHCIDACFYSLSGANGEDVSASLISAKNRGVAVRVIIEADNSNSAAITSLKNSGLPLIFDTFDPVNAGEGLLHNKFLIIDARDRSSDTDDWVVTGSWNATDQGLNNDAQNYIEIQDQALAVIYTKEFEEMWGGSTTTPSSSLSRFGARKTNNTPHQCDVKGTRVEVFFSPGDHTCDYLTRIVSNAMYSAYFCILTYTRNDIGSAMVSIKTAGKAVRGVFDNSSDQGSEFQFLQTSGVDVLLKKNLPGLLHHKYLIIDGDDPGAGADPIVATGSYNWSSSAENSNNENTIGIHSKAIALQYLQEWYRRYLDAGGAARIVLEIHGPDAVVSGTPMLRNYPNPVSRNSGFLTTVEFSINNGESPASLTLHDALGREIARLADGRYSAGTYSIALDLRSLPNGIYFCRLANGRALETTKLIVNK
jgi:phosphatidylserine/phosphatidylglycerophosphate/cardiolipin synthase-like enzyme